MTEVVRAVMQQKRITKGAVLYENQNPNDGPELTNIYIRKAAFKNGVFPSEIVVIIETPD